MKGAVCLVVCLFGVVLVVATVPQEGKQGSNETSDRKGNAQTDEVAPEKTGTKDVDSNEVKLKNRRSAQELPREKRDNTCDLDRVPSGLTERKAYKHFNFKFFDKHIKDEILNILNSDIAVEIGKIAENSRKDAVGAFDTKGTQDAFRYALTSYRVAEKYGYNTAKAFGDADERTHFRDLPTRLMALHNREVGRCLQKNRSTPEKSEVEVIKDALKSGKLQVVHDTSYDVKWPSFSEMWSNYPKYYTINSSPTIVQFCKLPSDLEGKNSCAMKLSRSLIASGHRIYFDPHGSQWGEYSNRDGDRYIVRVRMMREYLEKTRGAAKTTGSKEEDFKASLSNSKKGIIVFQDCNFSDATGHVDLWNGYKCRGDCYFDDCNNIRLFEFE